MFPFLLLKPTTFAEKLNSFAHIFLFFCYLIFFFSNIFLATSKKCLDPVTSTGGRMSYYISELLVFTVKCILSGET